MTWKRQPALDTGIKCPGDSLTSGGATGNSLTTTWPILLQRKISPQPTVSNDGIGGETSAQILTRMQAMYTPIPQICIIWAGRNDIGTLAENVTLANIASMVALIGDHGRFVILSVINSRAEAPNSVGGLAITSLNNALQATYPSNYIDVRTPLDNDAYRLLPGDALHINAAGNEVVAELVAQFGEDREWWARS